jgi:hypothetical protein
MRSSRTREPLEFAPRAESPGPSERITAGAFHLLVRLVLRSNPPARAKAIVCAIGRLLPAYPDTEAAARATSLLGRRGTCLTRSLAIAARLRGAEIVIGTRNPRVPPFAAHAWVEIRGRRVAAKDADMGDAMFMEIARLR